MLGPVEVLGDGGWESPAADKRRRALAALAVAPDRVTGVDELVDAIWGEHAPRSAVKVVQNHVLALRRDFGEDLVLTRPGGYVLGDDGELTDVRRFEHTAREGRDALERGEPGAASTVLADALRLWRGTPFVDLPDWTPARAERARLEELLALATEDGLDARIAAGRHEHAIPDLQAAVLTEPLRERRWALLMVALDRSGRPAEALRVFQRVRTLMREELGLDPGPVLQALDRSIASRGADAGVPDDEELLAAQRALAVAHLGARQRLAGDPAYRVTMHRAAELAATEDDRDALVEAATGGTRMTAPRDPSTPDDDLVAVLEDALERVDDDAGRARLLSALAQELAPAADGARRRALADEALACARRVGRAGLLPDVLARRPIAYCGPAHLDERLACTEEHLRIAVHTDDLDSWWTAAFTRLAAAVQAGLGEEVPVRLEQLRTATEMIDGAPHRFGLRMTEAWVALLHGRLPAAERLAAEAFACGRQIGEADAFGVYVGQLLVLRGAQGRLLELAGRIRAALDQPATNVSSRPISAAVLAEVGDRERAAELLRAEVDGSLATVPDQFLLTVAGAWGRVAARCELPDAAERLVELLDPWRAQVDFNGAYVAGSVAQVTGELREVLGRVAEARADLELARDAHRALDAPLLRARSEGALARLT